MGFSFDSSTIGDGGDVGKRSSSSWGGFRSLIRRKQVDSAHGKIENQQQSLAKELSIPQLLAIGVGTTIGAGVYVLVGTVSREHSGPALTISFLIAGIAAALSAFCYAELASRCPSAGSAYHYSYICVGEGVAWLVGWALILEYTIGGSAVARGISPNLALFFGGEGSLPFFLVRAYIPWLDVVVDPCAALLVLGVTGLLCVGIKESSFVQGIVTTANICVMVFIVIAGGYLGFQTGWAGYELPTGYFPFGVNGMLAGSATVFFAFIGFDSVASAAEEVKNPQRDLPLGIGISLSICCTLYMLVSIVIVGLVPYYAMDPDTPISSAFASHGMQWAVYIITAGAVTALCSTLLGSLLPQPRILMAMARDGLLPSFFSDVNKHTQVPVKSTIVTGICAALLAFFMDVAQLAGMVSVGTLLAFTIVAISILILRYVPPDEVPLPPSLQEPIGSVSVQCNYKEIDGENRKDPVTSSAHDIEVPIGYPLLVKVIDRDNEKISEQKRRKLAGWSIAFVCIGVLILTSATSAEYLPEWNDATVNYQNVLLSSGNDHPKGEKDVSNYRKGMGFSVPWLKYRKKPPASASIFGSGSYRFSLCGIGGMLLLCGLAVLSWIDQDDARHSFGHTGGFTCPFVPFIPIACILVNVYLLINLGTGTWIRVSLWLLIGTFVYVFYGRTHSALHDAVYVSTAHAEEIYQTSSEHLA